MKRNKQSFLPHFGGYVRRSKGGSFPNWGNARRAKGLIILLFVATLTFAQGTLKENGKTIATIPQYDLSGGNTEWTININQLYSYKWSAFFEFESVTGTKDGILTPYISINDGDSWAPYPGLSLDSITENKSISFDDSYTAYDQIKFVFTANSITGGTVNINQRLFTNPKK